MTHPGDSLTYHYDEAGRMTSLAYGLGTASWDYLANGLIARQTLPNGAWTDYAYDGANRIRQLINKDPSGNVLAAYGDTEYLATGDLAAWTAEVTGQANQSGSVAYDYDSKRRLIEETSTRLGGYDYDNAFDEAGNALEFRNDPHTYNADNQLVGPGTYVYDGNGNPTTWDGTALTWNVENRMTGYGTALTAGYRGDGLRAWKQPGGGNQTYFLYDGISVLCELDNTGAVSASATYGANGLLSRGTTEYQFDPLGDAVLLLDGAGAVTARQVFDGWGNALTGAVGPFGYRARYGYYADSATGLVALAYRYYGPGVGRFLNRDPNGFPGGINLMAYASESPVSWLDPSGLASLPPWAGPLVARLAVIIGVVAAIGIVTWLIGIAAENQTGNWDDERAGVDKKKHCYVCCVMAKWTLGLGYPFALLAQIIHEQLGHHDPFSGDSLFDSTACFEGANQGLRHFATGCDRLCERLVFCSGTTMYTSEVVG